MGIVYNPFTSTLDLTGTTTGGTGNVTVESFTLNGTNITDKFVTLSAAPANTAETVLLVRDAPNLFFSEDFTVLSGTHLSWNALALDGILAIGDQLTVIYKT